MLILPLHQDLIVLRSRNDGSVLGGRNLQVILDERPVGQAHGLLGQNNPWMRE
jgi:hypothetical protein